MKWVKDAKVEHHLRALGVKFETEHIALSDIDWTESANRQTRLGKKINDDWVLQYAQAMQDGADFPMPIINRLKKNLFIWSGLHRCSSAQLIGETHIDTYVVSITDPRIADILPRVVNAWEGHGLSKEEKLVNAKYFVDHHSMSTEDASKLLGLRQDWLSNYIRECRVRTAVQEAGVNANGLTKYILLALNTLADNPNILKPVTSLITKHHIKGDEARQIVSDVKRSATEAEKLATVAQWKSTIEARTKKPATKIPFTQKVRARFLRLLSQMARLLEKSNTPTQLQVVDKVDVELAKRESAIVVEKLYSAFGKGV